MKIIHQLDKHNNKIVNELWLIDGIKYHEGLQLKKLGFIWIKGPEGGCWKAPNYDSIKPLINGNIEIVKVGNGH